MMTGKRTRLSRKDQIDHQPKSMEVVCVFADIVGWSKLDNLPNQVAAANGLFLSLNTKIKNLELQVIWKSYTGDGFAIAFPQSDATRVLGLCDDLHEDFAQPGMHPVRLAVAAGPVMNFNNELLGGAKDYTGYAIIEARRILDGITSDNILLVQDTLGHELIKGIPLVVEM
jgi:hypothetical protein